MTVDIDRYGLEWSTSVAFCIAREEAHRRWMRSGGAFVADWNREYLEALPLVDDVDWLPSYPSSSWIDRSRREFESAALTYIRKRLSQSQLFDLTLEELRLRGIERLPPSEVLFSPYLPLYAVAAEVAREFLSLPETRNHRFTFGTGLPDPSPFDVMIAHRLAIKSESAAGFERLLMSHNASFATVDACVAASRAATVSKADHLVRWLLDLRVSVLASFSSSLASMSSRTAVTAEALHVAPLLEFIAMRICAQNSSQFSNVRSPYLVRDREVSTAREMLRVGRTISEVAIALSWPEQQVAELFGSRFWRRWTDIELDQLEDALRQSEPGESLVFEFALRDSSDRTCTEADQEDSGTIVLNRSPWDVALRVASILYDYRPYWNGVQFLDVEEPASPLDHGVLYRG